MSKTKTESTTTKTHSTSYFMNILSYFAVCIGGLALFLAMILGKLGVSANFTSIMSTIANAIGWLVLCVLSFSYIRRRKKIWMWVVWAIAVVMIVISIILVF